MWQITTCSSNFYEKYTYFCLHQGNTSLVCGPVKQAAEWKMTSWWCRLCKLIVSGMTEAERMPEVCD